MFPISFFLSPSMAPKRQFALLTIPGTDVVPVPPEKHLWALHPSVKDDTFWDNVAKGLTEASTPFEDRSSNSSRESDGYRTLYPDNSEGKGVVVPP